MRMKLIITEAQYKLLKEDNEYENLIRLASSNNIDNIQTALIISYNHDKDVQNEVLTHWLNFFSYGKKRNWIAQEDIILSSNDLDWLPDTITNLSNVERLFLDNNQLTTLPDNFGELRNLKELHLKNNFIEELPESFGNLSIYYLDLSDNLIENFPESIKSLNKLSFLDLSNNNISFIPEYLSEMQSLKYLKLKDNKLSEEEKDKVRKMLPHVKLALN